MTTYRPNARTSWGSSTLCRAGTASMLRSRWREKITATGPLAVATKRIITESWSPDTMLAEQMKILVPVFTSNDAKEGAIAFAEQAPAPGWMALSPATRR